MKSALDELKEASEAVIDVAAHPNRPHGLTPGDRLKIMRLRRAVLMVVMAGKPRHTPARWAPKLQIPTNEELVDQVSAKVSKKKVQGPPDQGATIF